MPQGNLIRISPFLCGPAAFLLGIASLAVLDVAPHVAVPLALAGLGIGIVGALREKPPLLPILGILPCAVTLLSFAAFYLIVAIILIVIFSPVLSPIASFISYLAQLVSDRADLKRNSGNSDGGDI